jgi:hypothetical protein
MTLHAVPENDTTIALIKGIRLLFAALAPYGTIRPDAIARIAEEA